MSEKSKGRTLDSRPWSWCNYYLFLFLLVFPIIAIVAIVIFDSTHDSRSFSLFAFGRGSAIISISANLVIEFVAFMMMIGARPNRSHTEENTEDTGKSEDGFMGYSLQKEDLPINSLNAFIVSVLTITSVFALIGTCFLKETTFAGENQQSMVSYILYICAFLIIAVFIGAFSIAAVFLFTDEFWQNKKENSQNALLFSLLVALMIGAGMIIRWVIKAQKASNELKIIETVNDVADASSMIYAVSLNVFVLALLWGFLFVVLYQILTANESDDTRAGKFKRELKNRSINVIEAVCDAALETAEQFTKVLDLPPKIMHLYLDSDDDVNNFKIQYEDSDNSNNSNKGNKSNNSNNSKKSKEPEKPEKTDGGDQ